MNADERHIILLTAAYLTGKIDKVTFIKMLREFAYSTYRFNVGLRECKEFADNVEAHVLGQIMNWRR